MGKACHNPLWAPSPDAKMHTTSWIHVLGKPNKYVDGGGTISTAIAGPHVSSWCGLRGDKTTHSHAHITQLVHTAMLLGPSSPCSKQPSMNLHLGQLQLPKLHPQSLGLSRCVQEAASHMLPVPCLMARTTSQANEQRKTDHARSGGCWTKAWHIGSSG